MKKMLMKLACLQNFIKREYILLVDNVFNVDAELCDNYALFEYLQSKPEYKDISFYIVNRYNSQYEEIRNKYPYNVIPTDFTRMSWAGIIKLVKTKYWLDSFQVINNFKDNLKKYLKNGPITTVYTQHGITFMKIAAQEDGVGIGDSTFDKVVMSNKQERNFFKRHYGYNDKNTILAGLSRWDNMPIPANNGEKNIFMYLTFRRYLVSSKGIRAELTNYIKNIIALCSSRRLSGILKQNNIKLYVAVHHVVSSHINIKLPNIELIDEKDISKFKQNASLFITDYSSMCFDYMYRDIPVIFYRLDYHDPLLAINWGDRVNEENSESNNNKVYNVFYEKDAVIDKIEEYCKNNFKLEEEFRKKNNQFFTYRDNIRQHIIEGILSSPLNIPNDCDREPAEYIEYDREYLFSDDLLYAISSEGLSRPTSIGRDTKNKNMRLWIRLPSKTSSTVVISLKPTKLKQSSFKIYLNNRFVCKYTIQTEHNITIPITGVDVNKDIQKIEFVANKINWFNKILLFQKQKRLNLSVLSLKVLIDVSNR